MKTKPAKTYSHKYTLAYNRLWKELDRFATIAENQGRPVRKLVYENNGFGLRTLNMTDRTKWPHDENSVLAWVPPLDPLGTRNWNS